jgi:cell division septation protein DedD
VVKPAELRSPIGRFVGAFVGFLAIIGAGVVWLSMDESPTNGKSRDGNKAAVSQSAPTGQPEPLFYKRLGTSPVVSDEPARKSGPGANSANGYTLEIRITETREEAEKLIDNLRESGVDAYYTPIAVRGRVQYRVRYGMFTEQQAAESASKKIAQAHNVKNKVIKLR